MTQDVAAARRADDKALQALGLFVREHRAELDEMARTISRIAEFLPEKVHATVTLADGEGVRIWTEDGRNHLVTWVDPRFDEAWAAAFPSA